MVTEAVLKRHLPGLAPTVALVWEHCMSARLERAGSCGAWERPATDPEVG
jgi:hypothetical protein